MECTVEGCDRLVLVKSRGLCRRHYLRWQRHGNPLGGGSLVGENVVCVVAGCDRPHEARGLCSPHYMRLWRGQDPHTAPAPGPPGPWGKFLAKIVVAIHPDSARPDLGECWLWQGCMNGGGYAQMRRDGKGVLAHRYAYEHELGRIRPRLDLDHLCRIRHCVRPRHLEPVTRSENLRRGYAARAQDNRRAVAADA